MKAETQKNPVPRHQRNPMTFRSLSNNTVAARFLLRERIMRLYERHLVFDNVIGIDGRRRRASDLRLSPAPCAMSCRSAGCTRRRPTSARTPSASTIFRWSFSSAARWRTMSPTFCLIPSPKQAVKQKNLDWFELAGTGTRCGAWEWRARAPGGLLSRFHGHDATSGHGLRLALRIRHLQTVHRGRLAT